MEALGAMTQLAMRMQPALAHMHLRKPDQGQLSIQDRASIFANACSPQAGNSSPTITTLELPNESEHQPEVKKLRRDLDSLTKQVDQQAEQIANQTATMTALQNPPRYQQKNPKQRRWQQHTQILWFKSSSTKWEALQTMTGCPRRLSDPGSNQGHLQDSNSKKGARAYV